MTNASKQWAILSKQVKGFEAMADMPDLGTRQRALLRRCDELYAIAEIGRSYTDKHGEEHSQPDSHTMLKCTELAARLLGVITEAEKNAKREDGDSRGVEIHQLVSLLRSMGYEIAEPKKSA